MTFSLFPLDFLCSRKRPGAPCELPHPLANTLPPDIIDSIGREALYLKIISSPDITFSEIALYPEKIAAQSYEHLWNKLKRYRGPIDCTLMTHAKLIEIMTLIEQQSHPIHRHGQYAAYFKALNGYYKKEGDFILGGAVTTSQWIRLQKARDIKDRDLMFCWGGGSGASNLSMLKALGCYEDLENLPTPDANAEEIRTYLNDEANASLLNKIRYLSFFSCHLREVPEEINRFPNLTELDLSHNALTKIPLLPATLTELNLSGNSFVGPLDLSYLKQLSKLDLSHNALITVPRLPARSLSSLILSCNHIKQLPDLTGYAQLRALTIDGEGMTLKGLPTTLEEITVYDDDRERNSKLYPEIRKRAPHASICIV